MNFLHLSLLAGSAAIAVPIMLHLFGQRKPKLVDFPALRFVRQTAREQSTSWQLRHFLLLLLRVLLLAVLAFALARPRVHSAMLGSVIGIGLLAACGLFATLVAVIAFATGRPAQIRITAAVIALALWTTCGVWALQSVRNGPQVPGGDSKAPIAVAIVVDNSPSMLYNSAGETRLQAAVEFAGWILEQLPLDSQVGILSGAPVGSLSLDPTTAATQVEIIEARGQSVDLASRIRTSVELVLASELERKEVYVVTDLMTSSWPTAEADLASMLGEYSTEVLVQIIDVGKQDRSNWHLSNVELDLTTAPVGADATAEVTLTRPADATDPSATVELVYQASDPSLPAWRDGVLVTPASRVVDRQVVDFQNQSTATVRLNASKLEAGTNNYWVQLDRPDPLTVDNRRFFSIPAYSQQPTLVVASDREMARTIAALVDPYASGAAEPLAQTSQYVQLSNVELERYAVVCLYDPPAISKATVEKLMRHVTGGGGLLIVLGPQVASPTSPVSELNELLPGKLKGLDQRTGANAFFDPVALAHPIFAEFGQWVSDLNWNRFPVFTNWTFDALYPDSSVLIQYSDNQHPAVISRSLGRGQILTLTTPIPEPESRTRQLWNQLWAAEDPYPAFGLMRGAFHVLSGVDNAGANFYAGQIVGLGNDERQWPRSYTYFAPQSREFTVTAADGQLVLGAVEQPGVYYLRGRRGGPIVRSFSVNTPAGDTLLERMRPEQLDEILGAGNYRLAARRDEVESSIGQARFGRELFPMLITLVAALFLAEQAMSNRFYSVSFGRSRGAQ